ncbi:MAG TPA: helix-turn-helix domain-containing protein [Acidimicrobiales bacterium]|nr:helix-turn-helix domain-containing protein [Acidimicrobiales bacterium]
MRSDVLIRRARHRAGLSQRDLAARAGTSHAAIAQYETGVKVPRTDTLERILQAAGFAPDVTLRPRPDGPPADREAKGRELLAALELAALFPLRRRARHLPPPAIRPQAGAPR